MNWSIEKLQKTWKLASEHHKGQIYASSKLNKQFDYIYHIRGVVFEVLNASQFSDDFDTEFAIQCAVLHDTIEDTKLTYSDIQNLFGAKIADGVSALTKDENLGTKSEMMVDSLSRIKSQPKEIWSVKLADRICNLQPPPSTWSSEKKENYIKEAKLIFNELKEGNEYLARRLNKKIDDYRNYL